MRRWVKAGLAIALAGLAAPLSAQMGGSEGESFLKALEDGENGKAVSFIEQPGSRIVNYRGYDGDTALHIVTRKRNLQWVGYLLNKGADTAMKDSSGDTALIIAARIGFDDAVDYMLRSGALPDVTNSKGETPLIVAVEQRRPRIVELLMKAGANPDKADHAAGYSARDYAKRDTRNPQLLKLIETVKSTRKKVAGPTVN